MSPSNDLIAAAILQLTGERVTSSCPSEVARALADDWRPLMARVRAVAATLQAAGLVRVTRGGLPVDALRPGGPVRLHAARLHAASKSAPD